MITAAKALESPRVKLNDRELIRFQQAEALITAAIHDNYNGIPFSVPLKIEDVSARIVHAIKRRFEHPENGWNVQVETLEDKGVMVGHRLSFEPAKQLSMQVSNKPTAQKSLLETLREELNGYSGGNVGPNLTLSENPLLSVIFGTYNRISHLKKAVESIRRSVGQMSYELVICDGGSTDGSREWLASQKDVILIGDRHLAGAVNAFNKCFANARGEYVANLNDDCAVEGDALPKGVKYLQEHPGAGQVAFSFKGDEEDWHINDVYPKAQFPAVTWPTTYTNFGITRKSVADTVAAITGGFWSPCYGTYAGDVELSAWVWKLGYTVDKLPALKIIDTRADDSLRDKNNVKAGDEAKLMYSRWPAESFKKDGPEPRVSPVELERLRRAVAGTLVQIAQVQVNPIVSNAQLVGWAEPQEEPKLIKIAPRLRALDPVEGKFPVRADRLPQERVLHVHMGTMADPQNGLVRALKKLGSGGYAQVLWYLIEHDERQKRILEAARKLMPTFVFMQLQEPNAVDIETVQQIRMISPGVVIATWNGDIASANSPWGADGKSNMDWSVGISRVCDLTLHSSMSHVHVLRAAGVSNAAFLNIGIDSEQYRLPKEDEVGYDPKPGLIRSYDYDVCFLGSRYGGTDAFSKSMSIHDGELRDQTVAAMQNVFGARFGLFGNGWNNEGKTVSLDKAHTVYWQSKIGLNVSLANFLDCYTSDRLHRIIGSGALLLTKSFPMMSVYGLKDGENCLVWETPDQAVELAKSVLADSARLEKISLAGNKIALEHHTWDSRILELIPYIDAVRSAR